MNKFVRKVTKFFAADLNSKDPTAERGNDLDSKNALSKNASQDDQLVEMVKRPNMYYNELQIFDAQEEVQCIKVMDRCRLAAGLTSGRIIVWDTLVGKQLKMLHNHHAPIKLLHGVSCGHSCSRLLSVCNNQLITIWDLDSGEMVKYFTLPENRKVRLVTHVSSPESSPYITLLFANTELTLSHVNCERLCDPALSENISRRNAGDSICEILESSDHIVCISQSATDIYEKQWDKDGRLLLNHTEAPHRLKSGIQQSCATLLSEDRFAIGTSCGDIYIYTLRRGVEPDYYAPFSDHPVRHLKELNYEWLMVIYDYTIHLVYQEDGASEYKLEFSTPLRLVRHISKSNLLVTLHEGSCKMVTWDFSSVNHDKSSWSRETPLTLNCQGSLIAHDSPIKGAEVITCGFVTFAKDSLVIVWRNKDEEMLRLFTSIQEKVN